MNILYFEDNAQDMTLVQRYISTTTHHFIPVYRWEDLDPRNASVDLVLLDILIEGQPLGLECVRMLREQGIRCPIVVITALAMPHQLADYERAGVDAVIKKPFDITDLAEIISYYASQY
ncbi:MAG TPA: response regulator [Aggregatilineales bacterium]|nr:response regulator [Aggregatilineales bacterium]